MDIGTNGARGHHVLSRATKERILDNGSAMILRQRTMVKSALDLLHKPKSVSSKAAQQVKIEIVGFRG